MEIQVRVAKNVYNLIFVLLIFSSFSCASHKKIQSEEKIYNLIKEHFKAENRKGEFLYKKTISVKNDSRFEWIKDHTLSEVLLDSIFRKNCGNILNGWSSDNISILNSKFKFLESVTLDQHFFSKSILNDNYLQKETYEEIPKYASIKITYPILIKIKNELYAFFVEESHNEGGMIFLYKLEKEKWRLVCKDSFWIF